MTREQRKQLRSEIVDYRKQGHYVRECCERFGVKESYVYLACRGIEYQWVKDTETMRQAAIEQGKHRKPDEQIAISMVARKIPQFEYIGGYTSYNGKVTLRCKYCDDVFDVSFWSVKQGKTVCGNCKKNDIEKRKAQKQLEKEQAKKAARRRSAYKKIKATSYQTTMKKCIACGGLFFGNEGRVYCSDKCRNHNKWYMKEGYRHLFPLEEVYKRDNGICYLCGCVCDWNDYQYKEGVRVYGNKYPSRDHVIPKSRGGKNEWSNIRLACRLCNSKKRDAPYVQKTG